MLGNILKKVFGSQSERELKRLQPLVDQINALEAKIVALSDEQLRSKTDEFRGRLTKGEALDALLPEAFAVVREAGRRVLGLRHFDTQLIGGMVLHQGKIAEMKTGEGKTLVSTLPAYLNALSGQSVHIVTVNDYLARRDSEWMGDIHRFLGLSVGVIVHGLSDAERKAAYACDITYCTNNELGFDYLRDNMKFSLDDYVQRDLSFAIVDEVDSILIDEARTPLIISGPSEGSSNHYYTVDKIIPKLVKGEMIEHRDGKIGLSSKEYTGDYTIDEKAKNAEFTEQGLLKVEQLLGITNLYDLQNNEILHHAKQALRAHALFRRDVDYVVNEGEIVIVDEFTGRMMPGRRWSDGLHQAIEAKEGVKIESENQTLATITFQNYFRMYKKLAGMTGTADTEATEFNEIYKLGVSVVPTNRPMIRIDQSDVIYKTEREKFNAVVADVVERHAKGQPSLVGTISIEKSETLAKMLREKGVPHSVLNAKHHDREAEIVAQAGRKGAVTIATNMAGRGTDIVLGGNAEMMAKHLAAGVADSEEVRSELLEKCQILCAKEREEVLAAGGLYICGTERHESRRIDNQLRGRSGRQGDPGESRFYLSLEDDLLRIFGSHRVAFIMDKLRIPENEPIEHGMISKAIENAQKKVEAHNYEIRKHLIDYDDVMNKQREVIYSQRKEVLAGEGVREIFQSIIDETIDNLVSSHCPPAVKGHAQHWDLDVLADECYTLFCFRPQLPTVQTPPEMIEALQVAVNNRFQEKEADFTTPVMDQLMKILLLQAIDGQWKDHLLSIDHLKEGIGLRGYAQKNPKEEYKKEAYSLFMDLMQRIRQEVVSKLFFVQLVHEEDVAQMEAEELERNRATLRDLSGADEEAAPRPVTRDEDKVGRNEMCPCGSGKKYKKCCGQG
ncbi:MAG: preprotein translocase subunit SecA [Desulfuromonadales bacterium]|nr:preprotein translocase subunit SecA [Desulfuromonadales bacterium]